MRLNGRAVHRINPDLTATVADLTHAKRLAQNQGVSFQGLTKGGPFEVAYSIARDWLLAPKNPNGLANAKVLRPIVSGGDIVKSRQFGWTIDFDSLDEKQAALFELPFQYALKKVKPLRENNNRPLYRERWWKFAEGRPSLRAQLASISRYIAYGWPEDLSTEEALEKLLALNLARSTRQEKRS